MNCSSRSQDIPPWKVIELPATPDVRHEINLRLPSYNNWPLSEHILLITDLSTEGGYLFTKDAINSFLMPITDIEISKRHNTPLSDNWNRRETIESYFRYMNPEGNNDWKNISPELRNRKMAIELIINDWYTYLQWIKDPTIKQIIWSHQYQLLNLVLNGRRETDWLHILDHDTRTVYKMQAFDVIVDIEEA